MEEIYDKIAKAFSDTRNFPWKEFEGIKNRIKDGDKILDIGCGNGRFFDYIKDMKIDYTGIDISRKMLDEARKKHPDIRFIKDDMRELASVSDERFDVIVLIASFHHLASNEERIMTLNNIAHLLKDDGIIFMTNWNLFQKKYRKHLFDSVKKSITEDTKWNDLHIPFTKGGKTTMRYYHAFTHLELKGLFKKSNLKIIKHWKGRNYNHILTKS